MLFCEEENPRKAGSIFKITVEYELGLIDNVLCFIVISLRISIVRLLSCAHTHISLCLAVVHVD